MNRDGALLLAALAFMAALAWAFAPGLPQTLALPAPQASAGGILWRDGQALVDVNQAGLELLQSLPESAPPWPSASWRTGRRTAPTHPWRTWTGCPV